MIDRDFKNAVDSDNIGLVRIMLKDSLMIDPTGKIFDELFNYAQESSESKLLEKHDGEKFIYDKKFWTEDFFNQEMIKLLDNFSLERINFLKEVCKFIYADYIKSKQNEKRVVKPLNNKISNRSIKVKRSTKNYSRIKYLGLIIFVIVLSILFKSCGN